MQTAFHLNNISIYSVIICLLQHHLYLIKVIALRLKANELIMADFCLLFGTLVIFFIVVRFFFSAVSVFYVLMGTYISVRQCLQDAEESDKAWKM